VLTSRKKDETIVLLKTELKEINLKFSELEVKHNTLKINHQDAVAELE